MPIKRLSQSGLLTFEKYSSMLAGNTAFIPGSYHLLETQILSSAQNSITFSNINTKYASSYQHLQLRAVFRTNRSGFTATYWGIRFNNDSGTNYSWNWLNGGYSGSTVESSGAANFSSMRSCWSPGANASANLFASSITDILDPFETSKNTTIRTLNGKTEAEQMVLLSGGAWRNTEAVSSITILDELNAQFVVGSRFSLYGLKG